MSETIEGDYQDQRPVIVALDRYLDARAAYHLRERNPIEGDPAGHVDSGGCPETRALASAEQALMDAIDARITMLISARLAREIKDLPLGGLELLVS